ncbi:hcf101 high-chlorophyll-fluorescence 101 [Klebsormidium nitens]|uniref:Fe-S cluster assembly factor HCF101, chloroplastic n=1 Tax=Klebsormidium nitens TaxID=105231 RepID=A0A1Y1HM25_KLENI|nr:hcf101 high-chlorophyll-fluorescence 101 [Klebsormidium nitens]|eukprot:GAQ77666.1 hcf101 high-chlorophyll-fluorescence 101 [Klebsormidium nitens]
MAACKALLKPALSCQGFALQQGRRGKLRQPAAPCLRTAYLQTSPSPAPLSSQNVAAKGWRQILEPPAQGFHTNSRPGLRGDDRGGARCQAQAQSNGAAMGASPEQEVLGKLSQIIDPDFGTDIVSCGFVKEMQIDPNTGVVSFTLQLTTPACPVKDMFESQARELVSQLPWVKDLSIKMTAQAPRPMTDEDVPPGLRKVANIIAVSSCKGGVGKSTVSVNLAYALHGMGARVGIFDADVYGPSLPTMVSPEVPVLQMRVEGDDRIIMPTEYEGVKLVSFGYAGQGSAIMRGPMVSGVVNQLLTTTDWGELDYLVLDFPPGTGDIQLTLCQAVPITAAVIVTTPQKLSFIDVVKGVRMFAKLKVPCIAVVENMCYFEADGKRYFPFGQGSGQKVVDQFGIASLFQMPIKPELSASGDTGKPQVIVEPAGEVARAFSELGASVVQQTARLRQQVATAVVYDPARKAIVVRPPGSDEEFLLSPALVRRNDRSAKSVDEWTGQQLLQYSDVAEDIVPESIRPMGNYAVAISWPDGLTQVAPYEQLENLERMLEDDDSAFAMPSTTSRVDGSSAADPAAPSSRPSATKAAGTGSVGAQAPLSDGAARILQEAARLKELAKS